MRQLYTMARIDHFIDLFRLHHQDQCIDLLLQGDRLHHQDLQEGQEIQEEDLDIEDDYRII